MIYRSSRPPVTIPNTPVADFVLARAHARGDRAALVDSITGRTITYGQLPDLVDRAATGLSRLGLGKGDVCAILSPNTPEYPIAMLAIAKLGAIATTASPLYTKADLGRHLTDSRARILITSASLVNTWTGVAADAGVDHVITFESEGAPSIAFNELLAEPAVPSDVTIDPADIVTLPYSSGTNVEVPACA